ncbi:MAG: tetratricopeptide repeat protein [Candidatus Heimdallarchaeota archaeon]
MSALPSELKEKLWGMPKDEKEFLLEELPFSARLSGDFLQAMLERAIKGLERDFSGSKSLATIVSMLSTLLGVPIAISNDIATATIKKTDVWGALQRFQRESSSSALENLDELLVVAQNEGDTILQLDVLQAMSFVLSRSDQYKRAEDTVAKLLSTLNVSDAIIHQSYLLAVMNIQGWIFRASGNVNESRNIIRLSATLARAGNYEYHFADALSNLGITYWTTGKFDSALIVLEDALAQRKSLNDLPGQAGVLNNLAMIHRKKGTFEEAQRCYEACLEIDRALGNLQGVAISQGNLANLLADRGLLYEAMKRLKEALKLKETLENRQGVAITHQSLAEILREMGNLRDAEEHIEKSIAIKKDLGDVSALAASYRSLAEIYSARGDYDPALKHLDLALSLERQHGNQWGEAVTLSIIGKINYIRGDLKAAREKLRSAIGFQEQLGTWESLDSRRLLAFVLDECGSTDEALRLLKVVGTRSQDRSSEYARYLIAKAILLTRVGHPSKEVLSYFWEAIGIGKSIRLSIEDTSQAYLGIAAHFLEIGQHKEAQELLTQLKAASGDYFPISCQILILESLIVSSTFNFTLAEKLLEKARSLVLQRQMGPRLIADIDSAQQTISRTQASFESLEKLSPVIESETGSLIQLSREEVLRYIEILQERLLSHRP